MLLQLPLLNDRLRFGPEEAVELIADDPLLVHLEQRRVGRAPYALTPAMAPERLLALLEGMGLDLDRRLALSRSLFRTSTPRHPNGPAPAPDQPGRRPQEPR